MAPSVLKDPKFQLKGHQYWVRAIEWSPDGESIATACADKNLRVFSADGSKELFKVGHPDWIWSVAFSYTSKRKRLATACLDGKIRVHDAATGRELMEIKGHTSTVNTIVFSPDTNYILSASYDKTARLVSVETGKTMKTIDSHGSPVLSAAFSSDSMTAFTGSILGEVLVTGVQQGNVIQRLQAHKGAVLSLAVAPSGALMASAGEDKVVHVWGVSANGNLKKIHTIKHADQVNGVTFSPDGTFLGTACSDSTCRVYQVAGDWEEMAIVKGHIDEANTVAFMSKGSRLLLATGSDDKNAKVWDLSPVSVALKVAQKREQSGVTQTKGPGVGKSNDVTVGDPADMDGID